MMQLSIIRLFDFERVEFFQMNVLTYG